MRFEEVLKKEPVQLPLGRLHRFRRIVRRFLRYDGYRRYSAC